MQNLTPDTINAFVKKNETALVLFYADWCPFCRAFLKLLDESKNSLRHEVVGARVNEEDNPMWDMFNVRYIPTLIAFSKGRVVTRRDSVPKIGLTKDDLLGIDGELA